MTDFAPGDVVVCVVAKPDRMDPKAHLLSEGTTYRVAAVGLRPHDGVLALGFRCLLADEPGRCWGFTATRFRKIRPASEQFTRQVRACRPIKQREPA